MIREDDSEAVIRERLDAYERQTRPVLDYFRKRDAGWSRWMPSNDPPEAVFAEDLPGDRKRMIVRKTAAELEKMRRSGLLVWQILQKLKEMAVEGVSTHGPRSGRREDDRRRRRASRRSKAIMCRRRARLTSLCCAPR